MPWLWHFFLVNTVQSVCVSFCCYSLAFVCLPTESEYLGEAGSLHEVFNLIQDYHLPPTSVLCDLFIQVHYQKDKLFWSQEIYFSKERSLTDGSHYHFVSLLLCRATLEWKRVVSMLPLGKMGWKTFLMWIRRTLSEWPDHCGQTLILNRFFLYSVERGIMPCQMPKFCTLCMSIENISFVSHPTFPAEVKAVSLYLIGYLQFIKGGSIVKSSWGICRS